MITVSNKQVDKLNNLIIENHISEMIRFVEKYYPNHSKLLGDNINNYVTQVINKAFEYKLTSEKNIYLLLNMSLLLGAYFDKNPLYEWCSTFQLKNTPDQDLENIATITLKKIHQITGNDHQKIYRLIVLFQKEKDSIFLKLKKSENIISFIKQLQEIYPSKFEIVDLEKIKILHNNSKKIGKKYLILKEENLYILSFLQFCIGYDFDRDLLFHFMNKIFLSKMDEDSKCELLYNDSIVTLEKFLNR